MATRPLLLPLLLLTNDERRRRRTMNDDDDDDDDDDDNLNVILRLRRRGRTLHYTSIFSKVGIIRSFGNFGLELQHFCFVHSILRRWIEHFAR